MSRRCERTTSTPRAAASNSVRCFSPNFSPKGNRRGLQRAQLPWTPDRDGPPRLECAPQAGIAHRAALEVGEQSPAVRGERRASPLNALLGVAELEGSAVPCDTDQPVEVVGERVLADNECAAGRDRDVVREAHDLGAGRLVGQH